MKIHLINETHDTSVVGHSCEFGDLGKRKDTIEKGLHIILDGTIKTSPIGEIYQTVTNNFYTIYRFKTMDNIVYRLLVPHHG